MAAAALPSFVSCSGPPGEGWTERLPGRGWTFIPLLTSEFTYEQICRYRIVVEPAAMLEPTFVLDRPALEACRREQMALFNGGGNGLSPVEIFESGSRFHQTVLACSSNPFFINGLDQANRVRRLMEYRKTLHSPHWLRRCPGACAHCRTAAQGRARSSLRPHAPASRGGGSGEELAALSAGLSSHP